MKLVFAIVQKEDSQKVIDELNSKSFSVTTLATTGGFLKSGNTTLIVGVEEDKVEQVIDIIKNKSKSRNRAITSSSSSGASAGMYALHPIEVTVGGATIFVMNVERFEKI